MLEPEIQDASICQHHWVIDSPNGPVSKGVCRICGEEREFQNSIEGSSFGTVYKERLPGNSRFQSDIETKPRVTGGTRDEELNEGV